MLQNPRWKQSYGDCRDKRLLVESRLLIGGARWGTNKTQSEPKLVLQASAGNKKKDRDKVNVYSEERAKFELHNCHWLGALKRRWRVAMYIVTGKNEHALQLLYSAMSYVQHILSINGCRFNVILFQYAAPQNAENKTGVMERRTLDDVTPLTEPEHFERADSDSRSHSELK